MSDPVRVEIGLPLPMDVAGTLMEVIGIAYPNSMVRTDGRPGRMTMEILESDRGSKPIPKRKVKAARQEASPDDTEVELAGFAEEEGALVMKVSTPQEATRRLAEWAVLMLDNPDATNYVEQEATTAEGLRFVVIAARSKAQTPHKLRMKAEKSYAELVETMYDFAATLDAEADAGRHDDLGVTARGVRRTTAGRLRELLPAQQTPAAPGHGSTEGIT